VGGMTISKGKVLINIEVTREQKRVIEQHAALHNLPTATYVRMKALEDPIERNEND
jgi:uncharacterized protein (DUF1778 family)